MITSLSLKNWRTHKETTLDFGAGSNVIVGVMGSGKSSVVNAMSYALFGTFPALKNKSVSLKETIMNKPNQCDKAIATLSFTHENKTYTVERAIKADGANEANLYEKNELVADSRPKLVAGPKQKDVNERIESIIGMSYELFSRAVYAEQNEMDFFLKLSPGDRKKKFDELLELEKYESARKNSTALQNEMTKENKQRAEFIERQKETIRAHEEDKLLKLITEEEGAIKELAAELEKAKKGVVEYEKKYKELAEKEKKHKELEDARLTNTSKAEDLKEAITKSEKLSLKAITEALMLGKKEIAVTEEKLKVLQKELKAVEGIAKKASEEIRVFEYRKRELAAEEKEINSLKGTCPKCKQDIKETHHKTMLAKIETELKNIEAELREKQKSGAEIVQKIEALEKEEGAFEKKLDSGKKELYVLEGQEKQAKELEEKKTRLEKLVAEKPIIVKEVAELGFDKKALDFAREEYFKKKSQVSVTETKIKSKQELKKSHEDSLTKVGLIKDTIKEAEKELVKTEEAAKKLGVFGNCLMATQTELREELLQTINSAMTQIWETLYPYKDFTDAKLYVVEDGYDLQVQTRNGEWVRVEGILSGGERSAAALCIRIAFALVLTKNLSMLILDEPTHNLDTNAVGKLSEMLREQLPKLVGQIFVITHDKQLETAASSNLYLLTRNKDLDEATKAEMLAVE